MTDLQKAKAAVLENGILKHFMSKSQRTVLQIALRGEEANHFSDVVSELTAVIEKMPKTGETDGQGMDAIAYLHYFRGSVDSHITEKDMGDGTDDLRQLQAFGLQNLGYGAELGYISIDELIFNGLEVDLYWTPKALKDIK